MTVRTIDGLTFIVTSPSSWEFCFPHSGHPFWRVLIEYTGEVWSLVVHMNEGHVIRRAFASRDAIISLLQQRNAA